MGPDNYIWVTVSLDRTFVWGVGGRIEGDLDGFAIAWPEMLASTLN